MIFPELVLGIARGADEGNHRHFHVEIIPDRSASSVFGKRPGIFDFGDDLLSRFAVFLNLERGTQLCRIRLHDSHDILMSCG